MSRTAYAVRRNQNLARERGKLQLGPISVSFLAVAVICVLALLYLTQVAKSSVYGHELNQLKSHQQKLVQEKDELEVEAARLRSVRRIESSPVVKNMVTEDNVTYGAK